MYQWISNILILQRYIKKWLFFWGMGCCVRNVQTPGFEFKLTDSSISMATMGTTNRPHEMKMHFPGFIHITVLIDQVSVDIYDYHPKILFELFGFFVCVCLFLQQNLSILSSCVP